MAPLEAEHKQVRILLAHVNRFSGGCLSTTLLIVGILLGLVCLAIVATGAK